MARPATRTGTLKKHLHPLPQLVARRGIGKPFKKLSADLDFEYVLINATIDKVRADAGSQKVA